MPVLEVVAGIDVVVVDKRWDPHQAGIDEVAVDKRWDPHQAVILR